MGELGEKTLRFVVCAVQKDAQELRFFWGFFFCDGKVRFLHLKTRILAKEDEVLPHLERNSCLVKDSLIF